MKIEDAFQVLQFCVKSKICKVNKIVFIKDAVALRK